MSNKIIAWDFDGVLNANIRDGRFIWADTFEADIGLSRRAFVQHIFGQNLTPILTGQEDLRDRVSEWARLAGYAPGADALLDYWFPRDMFPDADVLSLIDDLRASGVRHVMATNNEWRRTAFIEAAPDFSPRMDRIFAAGPMGLCKPDPRFFETVATQMETAPDQMILVDDHADNIAAARELGWSAYHFTPQTRAGLPVFLHSETGAAE